MSRSPLKLFVGILAICAVMIAPTAVLGQAARQAPGVPEAGSLWSELGQWLDEVLGWSGVTAPPPRVEIRAASARGAGSTATSPGDWQCLDCAEIGPDLDPDG